MTRPWALTIAADYLKLAWAMALCISVSAAAQSTTQSAVECGPLLIHITAVLGGAQYRLGPNDKWQRVTEGLDLQEGVELRTGPRGTIQFTIGTDQICRVDRLSVVKVLRADLLPDGTIKTDVGLNYGRISKDVDEPKRTHDDTIVSPAATMAVRGTHVSLYDQPPYDPEAVSLTGAALFRTWTGFPVHLGAKGEGTAAVTGDAPGAAQNQIQTSDIAPKGFFCGTTPPEQTVETSQPGGPAGDYGSASAFYGEKTILAQIAESSRFVLGTLDFTLNWSSSTPQTVVDLAVTSPLRETVSPAQTTAPSGGAYLGSDAASSVADLQGNYDGLEAISWNSMKNNNFPTGTYTITETFRGVSTGMSVVSSPGPVTTNLVISQIPPTGGGQTNYVYGNPVTLTHDDSTATFTIKTPITLGQQIAAAARRR